MTSNIISELDLNAKRVKRNTMGLAWVVVGVLHHVAHPRVGPERRRTTPLITSHTHAAVGPLPQHHGGAPQRNDSQSRF
jgi:hypothetical protein